MNLPASTHPEDLISLGIEHQDSILMQCRQPSKESSLAIYVPESDVPAVSSVAAVEADAVVNDVILPAESHNPALLLLCDALGWMACLRVVLQLSEAANSRQRAEATGVLHAISATSIEG